MERINEILKGGSADLAIFPELYLSGYRVGDRIHQVALSETDGPMETLRQIAAAWGGDIAVGAPLRSKSRPGEVHNAVLVVRTDGSIDSQVKRYLPTYGPFEEGSFFTPTDTSVPLIVAGHRVGFEICYDAFFPEVARQLAMEGAEALVNVSASPVTSRRLFDKVLPARAVENACPVVYVNRVGVEDGLVYGGGTGAWDARGEPIPQEELAVPGLRPDELVARVELDPSDVGRWRPFRPVLRDLSSRPSSADLPRA